MIRQIELENFRSHKKTNLNFTEGNNILVGISGSGKTSVLDAICFALYGNMPKIQKRKLKLCQLIMDKPIKEESAKIKLLFEINEKKYEIKREICRSKPSGAELRENGRLIAVNPAQVTEYVEQILKVDYEMFSKVIYAEQNNVDYFLTIPPGNRMEDIDKLLKLSKFELARAKTVSISNKFKNLKNAKEEAILNFDEEDLKNKKAELEEYIEKMEREEIDIKDKINKTKTLLKNKEELLQELEKKKIEVETIRKKFIETKTKISVFQREVEEGPTGDVRIITKELSEKKLKLENLEREERERERKISGINSKIVELEKEVEEKRDAENFLRNFNSERFKDVEREVEQLKEDMINKKLRIEELNKAIQSLRESKERCPTCDRELNEEKRKELIDKKKREYNLLLTNINKLNEEYINKKTEMESELKNVERANFFKKRLEQLKNVELDLHTLKEELKELAGREVNLTDLKEEVKKLESLLEKLKSIEMKKHELEELLMEQKELEEEMKKISFDEPMFEMVRKEVEEMKRELISLELDLKYKIEIKEEKKRTLNQIKNDLKFLEKSKEDIEFLNYAYNTLTNFSVCLIEIQELLRQEFVQTLNEVMNVVWSYLYPYEDFIGIRFKIEDRDYVLQLCDLRNKWVNVEGVSSGGERAIASLVMRIALSIVLAPNLRLLVLDEPTHNLDSNTIENLTEILRTKIADLLEQTFIVTHDERLIQAGTGYIYEFRRESSKKEPTKVREIHI